jgi:uncharacterized protein (DUF1330 family)
MPAFVIAEFDAIDRADPPIARLDKTGVGRFGERMRVDSSRCETLAGDWTPQRIVVLEFPTLERAQAWWSARERSAPRQIGPVKRNMMLVAGLGTP